MRGDTRQTSDSPPLLRQRGRLHDEYEGRFSYSGNNGSLVQVLADWPCSGLPVSVLYPKHRQHPPRVRVFTDWVVGLYAEKFGPAPPC